MSKTFLLILSLIVASGLVLGSEAKKDDTGLKKKDRKKRASSEGSASGRHSESDSRTSSRGKSYADRVLDEIGFDVSEREKRGIMTPDFRHQQSSDSLSDMVGSNDCSSPVLKVTGTLDHTSKRIVFGYDRNPKLSHKAEFPPGYFDDNDAETTRESERRRRNSESGGSGKKKSSSEKGSSSHK